MDIADQLTKIITSSSDPEELKNKIVKEVAIALNAAQCFFIEYDSTIHNFKKITNLYSLKRNVESLLGYDIEKKLKYLAVKLKYMKSFIIDDTDLFIKTNKLENTNEAKYFEDFDVKAFLAVRLEFGETFSGILAINYDEKKEKLQETDLPLLVNVAEHLSIALHLSKLYIEEKRKSEREKLLNSIVSIMGESYDLDKINQKVFTILGNVYNAQSIFVNIDAEIIRKFYYYNFSKDKTIEFKEDEKEALVNLYNLHNFDFVRSRLNYISNVHHFIISNNLENTFIEKYFNENNIKSLILLPILHEFLSYGLLIIHFDVTNSISRDDLELFRTITIQLGLEIKQVILREKEKIAFEREKILGAILNNSISTFDINQIKPIVQDVGILAKADRCYFVEAEEEGKSGKQIYYDREYLVSTDVKSAIGYDFPTEDVHKFVEMYTEAKDLIVFDYEEILQSSEEDFKGMQQYIRRFDLKSGIGIPLFYEGKLHAVLAIEYIKEKVLPTADELEFYRILGKHANMVLNQIKLFENTKRTAERENLLRKISEKIRNTLLVDSTLQSICEEVSVVFNAQRVSIVEFFDKTNFENWIIRKEYKQNPDVKGLDDVCFPKAAGDYNGRTILKEGKNLIVDNIEESELPDYYKETYKNMGVKSILSVPIKSESDEFGIILLSITDQYRNWTREDVELLELISVQIHIAIKQAELYEKQKLSAERERISRNIIEILRSSIDKTIIKKLFVKNIGKFFDADRVLLSEYDSVKKIYLPVDENSEYLLNQNEKSFKGFEWSKPEASEFIQPLLEKKELNIYNFDEYIKENPKSQDFINLFENYNLKSSYNFPIVYQQNIMGFFCIDFMGEAKCLSDEDIGRIRNICTQAGIALYHSNLYAEASECLKSRKTFIKDICGQVQEPACKILDLSTLLSQKKFTQPKKIEHINEIINSCEQLIELTKKYLGGE